MESNHNSFANKIGCVGLLLAVAAIVVGVTTPEIRVRLGLQNRPDVSKDNGPVENSKNTPARPEIASPQTANNADVSQTVKPGATGSAHGTAMQKTPVTETKAALAGKWIRESMVGDEIWEFTDDGKVMINGKETFTYRIKNDGELRLNNMNFRVSAQGDTLTLSTPVPIGLFNKYYAPLVTLDRYK